MFILTFYVFPVSPIAFFRVWSHHQAREESGVDQSRLSQLHPRRHISSHTEVRILGAKFRGPIQSHYYGTHMLFEVGKNGAIVTQPTQ